MLGAAFGLVLATAGVDGAIAAPSPTGTPFVFNFEGTPPAPQPWNPKTWDVGVESRNTNTYVQLEGMQAQHGADCSPYPATHFNSTYEGAVFLCRNHIMTAINAGGYGEIALTPDHMIDFSGGAATIRFDLSTLRTSYRDWVDIWITPLNDNLVFPLDFPVDLQGPPAHAIQVKMDHFQGTVFGAYRYDNFKSQQLRSNNSRSVEKLVSTPSATARTTYELTISPTHLRFGVPSPGYSWVDTPLTALGWSRGIVQLVHHSYNPSKDCKDQLLPVCVANTWHWSNFSISNAVPFTLLRGNPQVVHGAPGVVTFPAGAPKSAFLRFAAVGSIEISFDGGKHWQAAARQAQKFNYAEHFASYWTPIPDGTKSLTIRGTKWFAGPWWVRDISIWSSAAPTGHKPAGPGAAPVGSPPPAAATAKKATTPLQAVLTTVVTHPVAAGASAIGAVLLVGLGYLFLVRRRRIRPPTK